MIEFVWIDGTAVHVTSYVQTEASPREVDLVVIVRGERAHREFVELVAPGWVIVEIPTEDGRERFGARVVRARHDVIGAADARAYRHEVTLREGVRSDEDGETPVAVRLAALIEALDATGIVKRDDVDAIARRMMAGRRD